MHVLVQKDVGSRWLNRFVVLILLAIIAIQLSTYLKPKNDVAGEEARAAAVIEGMRRQHERELSVLAAKRVQEKAEADTQHERRADDALRGEARSGESGSGYAARGALAENQRATERERPEAGQTGRCSGPAEAREQPAGGRAHPVARADGGPDRQNKARPGYREWWGEAGSGCESSIRDPREDCRGSRRRRCRREWTAAAGCRSGTAGRGRTGLCLLLQAGRGFLSCGEVRRRGPNLLGPDRAISQGQGELSEARRLFCLAATVRQGDCRLHDGDHACAR